MLATSGKRIMAIKSVVMEAYRGLRGRKGDCSPRGSRGLSPSL